MLARFTLIDYDREIALVAIDFRNRFENTIRPFYLAPFCHHRHNMPLFLSPLVCGLTIYRSSS
jgi:hypothetical protein